MTLSIGIILYILFVILPIIFWVLFFRNKDKSEPEPLLLIIKLIFIGGILSIIISVIFEYIIDGFFLGDYDIYQYMDNRDTLDIPLLFVFISALGGVVIEEVAKYFFLIRKIYFLPSFNQIRDGIIYGISLGVGFAFFENTFYFLDSIVAGESILDTTILVIVRAIGPLLMHVVTTGIIGLYIGKKKFTKGHKNFLIIKGISIAIALHFIYNASIVFFGVLIPGLAVVVIGFLYLLAEMNKKQNRMVWKIIEK